MLGSIYSYDDWGIPNSETLGASGSRFRYTGQIWLAELGMYYYKARIYSATMGRFLQTDPIGYEDGPHLYAYVGNDPINARDPTGMYECRTRESCQAARQGSEQMRQALNHYRRQSTSVRASSGQRHAARVAARAVENGLRTLGNENDGNGLTVETASLNANYGSNALTLGDYNPRNATIRLDMRAIAARGTVGGTLTHEVFHHRLRGANLNGMGAEVLPFMAQWVVERGLGHHRDQGLSSWVRDRLIPYCGPDGPLCRRGASDAYDRESERPF